MMLIFQGKSLMKYSNEYPIKFEGRSCQRLNKPLSHDPQRQDLLPQKTHCDNCHLDSLDHCIDNDITCDWTAKSVRKVGKVPSAISRSRGWWG